MWLDVSISIALGTLAVVVAYLGIDVALHPSESAATRKRYEVTFITCAACTISLVVLQSERNRQGQQGALAQIAALKADVVDAKNEARNLRTDLQLENARRQQAEKELAMIVQDSGYSTRASVGQDIRNAPVKADVNVQRTRDNGPRTRDVGKANTIKEILGLYMHRGAELRDRCRTDKPESTLDAEAQKWFDDVQSYLRDNLDASYVNQFILAKPKALSPSGVPQQRVNLYLSINERVQLLNSFIDQLP
jgi:hypothetical protein